MKIATLFTTALVIATAVVSALSSVPELSKVKKIEYARKQFFSDASGRVRIFRGVNVVYKGFPYTPQISANADPRYSFNEKDIQDLASVGVTAIRLGVMWAGVEPNRGQYDQNYLSTMRWIAETCQKYGIYVLLDMHQDVLSEKFCGEGVPLWAAQSWSGPFNLLGFPRPLQLDTFNRDRNGIPSAADCAKHDWASYQFAFETNIAYQRLYDNYDGLRDSWVNYWKVVTKTFLGLDNILGYDLINEPFAGDVYLNPTLLIPGVADRVNLQQFMARGAEGVRSVDPNAIIFIEGVTWDNFVVGFTEVPGGDAYKEKTAISFHHYNPPNLFNMNVTIVERLLDMERLGCGGMMTEFDMGYFGVGVYDPNMGGKNVPNIRRSSKAMEKKFISYLGWSYNEYANITGDTSGLKDYHGNIRPDMGDVYSRTYATAVAGLPVSQNFDDDSGLYTISFIQGSYGPSSNVVQLKDNGITSTVTELRLSTEWHYPNGYDVSVRIGGDEDVRVRGSKGGNSKGDGGRVSITTADGFVYVMAKDENNARYLGGKEVVITVTKL
ncbi:hypothetical protein HDU97_005460 [Phlyctochytrium planicorne]|nr:hypothetical protein HDU97_005460 [Phlyctochytrium planicorne]